MSVLVDTSITRNRTDVKFTRWITIEGATVKYVGKVSEKKKQNFEDLVKKSIEQMREYRAASIQRQAEFFAKISVDEYVCRIGNEINEFRNQ